MIFVSHSTCERARRFVGLRAVATCLVWAVVVVVVTHAAYGAEILTLSYRITETPSFDRVVFNFRGGAPGWHAGYVPQESADASGSPVPLEGRAFFNLTLTPAHASYPRSSRPTPAERSATPRLAILRQVKPAGDFEGYVGFGFGLSRHVGYHIFALRNPTRIVVDFSR